MPELLRWLQPLQGPLVPMLVVAVSGVAWRFRRGRMLHGLLVLVAAGGAVALTPGPARDLAALLVPLNLALLALLPDRGITTRGGIVRAGALVAQAAAVLLLAAAATSPAAAEALFRVTVPGLAHDLDSILIGYGLALGLLAATTLVRGDAAARGLLWTTAAALAAYVGHPAGVVWVLLAGALVLLVAALEDAHSLAFHDGLTGLPSRRALDEMLQRSVSGYTLAMVDVDHFKSFNDTHGHDVGDQVLRMVATRLRETRGGARAFRYGGEEFTLVFKGMSLEQARPFLDETRERIAASSFGLRARDRPRKKPKKAADRPKRKTKRLSVTVSIGAAERSDASQPYSEVVAAADRALYQAKDDGRNRVMA